MPFTVPTLEEVHATLCDDYQSRFPNDDVSRGSDAWLRLRTLAGAVVDLHAHIDSVHDDLMADSAEDEFLDRIGTVYNVPRKGATAARKADALRVTGTVGATFSTTDEKTLVHADGTRYLITDTGTLTIPSGGYLDVDVAGIDTGAITRKDAGQVLTFVSPATNIDADATLQLDLDLDGEDQELNEPYRARILDKIGSPGMGGNANDYRAWALEVEGVSTAYEWSHRNGIGSVDVAALHTGRGTSRLFLTGENTALEDYIEALRPVSVPDFRVIAVTAQPEDVEILIEPEDGSQNAFDWDDSTPFVVSAWDATLLRLTLTAPVPDDLDEGDRLIFKSVAGPYNDGAELVVESKSGSYVIVRAAPAQPPVAGDLVYSGGPLVQPVRDQVLALFDSLGPARGSYAAKALRWEDSLRTSTLFKLAQLTSGVLDSEITTPSANVTPTDPDGTVASVPLLTPRQVIVRRRW